MGQLGAESESRACKATVPHKRRQASSAIMCGFGLRYSLQVARVDIRKWPVADLRTSGQILSYGVGVTWRPNARTIGMNLISARPEAAQVAGYQFCEVWECNGAERGPPKWCRAKTVFSSVILYKPLFMALYGSTLIWWKVAAEGGLYQQSAAAPRH